MWGCTGLYGAARDWRVMTGLEWNVLDEGRGKERKGEEGKGRERVEKGEPS